MNHLGHVIDAHVERWRVEFRVENVRDCDIEHRIHRMFLFHLRNLADLQVLILLQLRVAAFEHKNIFDLVGDYARLGRIAKFRPALRIRELEQSILKRTGSRIAPGWRIVPQVPILEGEGETLLEHEALAEDADATLYAALEPSQLFAEALGIGVID